MRKNAYMIGAIVLVVGLVICFGALASVGFDARKLGNQLEFEQKQFFTEAAQVRALTVDEQNNTIELIPSTDGKITVTYYESEQDHYAVDVDDAGRLSVRYFTDRKWYDYIGIQWGYQDTRLTIALPADFGGEVSLKTVNGTVSAQGLTVGALTVANTNGMVQLSDISASGASVISTVNGQITLNQLAADSISATSVNGRIQVERATSNAAITLTTVNGAVTGTLGGSEQDYSIDADTVNGSNNLKNNSSGAKQLKVRTTNGTIDIRFAP